MEETRPTRRRHWFQFSLRTFLVAIMLVGFGGAWLGMQLQQKRRHQAVVDEILQLGGNVQYANDRVVPAWKERLFGIYALYDVQLNLGPTK